MTSLLTLVVCEPQEGTNALVAGADWHEIVIEAAEDSPDSRHPNWEAFRRKVNLPAEVLAFWLLTETTDGYRSSFPFFLDEEMNGRLRIYFDKSMRQDIDALLSVLLHQSGSRRLLLFDDPTMFFIDEDVSSGEPSYDWSDPYADFDIADPMSLGGLWLLHDTWGLFEGVIYEVVSTVPEPAQ